MECWGDDVPSLTRYYEEYNDRLYDKAAELMQKIRFANTRTRADAEQAIALMEQTHHPKSDSSAGTRAPHVYISERGIVVYTDLLKRLFAHRIRIETDDYLAMVCRCIEYKPNETVCEDDWHHTSLDFLLSPSIVSVQACTDSAQSRLMIITPKYNINRTLYDRARAVGLRDPWYDHALGRSPQSPRLPYTMPMPMDVDASGRYCGYRVIYHLLTYGSADDRKSLVEMWDQYGYGHHDAPDCTFDAARDILGANGCSFAEVRNMLLQTKSSTDSAL